MKISLFVLAPAAIDAAATLFDHLFGDGGGESTGLYYNDVYDYEPVSKINDYEPFALYNRLRK